LAAGARKDAHASHVLGGGTLHGHASARTRLRRACGLLCWPSKDGLAGVAAARGVLGRSAERLVLVDSRWYLRFDKPRVPRATICKAVVLAHGALRRRLPARNACRGGCGLEGARPHVCHQVSTALQEEHARAACVPRHWCCRSGTFSRRRGSLCVWVCVCFVFLPLDSAWRLALQRRRAPIYVCFAYVWWNVLRVLVMFSSFSVLL
jgi:hypothetical protein